MTQLRASTNELNHETTVRASAWQLLAVIGTAISSTAFITWYVMAYLVGMNAKIDKGHELIASNAEAIRAEVKIIRDEIDVERRGKDARLAVWTPWSYTVTRDIQAIGRAAKVDVDTKDFPRTPNQ